MQSAEFDFKVDASNFTFGLAREPESERGTAYLRPQSAPVEESESD